MVYPTIYDEVSIVANPRYKGSAEKKFEIKHTRLMLTPNWQQRTLQGHAELTVSPFAYAQDTLVLDAKSFDIQLVVLAGGKAGDKILSHIYDKRKILIPLDKQYKPGEKIQVSISYTAKPEQQIPEGIIKQKADQGLFFIDPDNTDPYLPRQLWTQGEVQNNSAWFPTIDEPNQKFTQEIYLTVDTSLETLSNGALVYSNFNKDGTRTDFWQQKQPHSAYLSMIAVGDWHIEKDNWRDSIPVEYYVEHDYAPYAKLIFGKTPEMMEFYSKLLGIDYPWEKYSQVVVREFVSGAMENTTATVHFEPVQHDDREHLDETYESIIAHELFHHWFGDMVTAEAWGDLALNESLATYGERLWEEYKYGKDAAAYGRLQDLDAYLGETIYTREAIINHYYNDAEELFDRHRYEKGGLVLHMLRTILGDEVFYKALHNYLKDNAFKTVEIHQLRIAFEEASGQDLNWFFDQWFLKAGHPSLVIKQQYNKSKNTLVLHVEQTQKGKNIPLFKMPVEVHIYLPGKMLSHKIWLGKSKDSFSFSVPQAPLLVNFDAQKYLLAQKVEVKPAAQWYYQFMHEKNYADKYEALQAISQHTNTIGEDSLHRLITRALQDSFWNIRNRAINTLLGNSSRNIQNSFIPAITILSQKDKKSRVRLAAYVFLVNGQGLSAQERKAFLAEDIYAQALKDSSYQVIAMAISGLRLHTEEHDAKKALAMVNPFENYRNSDVLFALAQFYAQHPDTSRLAFFHHIPAHMASHEYGRFTDVYKQFIEAMPAHILVQEKDFILSLAPKIKDVWAKISYKAMLMSFAERLRSSDSLGIEGKQAADEFAHAAENISLGTE
ncbi:MAG: M1 family aminopeptidase [Bacteroidia bacterium]